MHSRKTLFISVSVFLALTVALSRDLRPAGAFEPPGFSYEPYASGLNLPIDAEFMPDGGILVAEKGVGAGPDGVSNIRLVRDGAVQEVPVLSLSTNTFGDSGILGMILSPDFAENFYFYIWYGIGNEAQGWTGTTVYRLSRFTFDPLSETADLESELVMIDHVAAGLAHNGGGMAFDEDGLLYLATGDGTVPSRSQNLNSLNGKMLRIRPTETGYVVPETNPFVGDPNVKEEIFAYGLRSPHRITLRASTGQIYAADVGESKWEEINAIESGANYGWPIREGPCPNGQIEPCPPAPPEFTDPLLYYLHPSPSIGAAVSAIVFYDGDAFPENYHDSAFFADINQGFIGNSDLANPPVTDGEFEIFDPAAGYLVDAVQHGEALYFVDIYSGQLMELVYTGADPQPHAVISAEPATGPAPLIVDFSAAGSIIIDGTTPTYHWDFGDGSSPLSTASPEVSYSYPDDGNYTAGLWITDDGGGVSNTAETPITVYSGEMPVIELTNLTDPERTLFYGGDQIEYLASRSTLADLDPETPFSWDVALMHNQHFHPIISGHAVISDTLDIDRSDHGGSVNLWYRFTLTMLTGDGISVEVTEEIFPKVVSHTVTTAPFDPGITRVSISNVLHPVPHQFPTIVGTEIPVVAPAVIFFEDGIYAFSSWSPQPGGDPFILFVSPETETTLTAAYDFIGAAYKLWLPSLFTDG